MIAGALYLVGKRLEEKAPFLRRVCISLTVAIIVSITLRVIGFVQGVSLLEITIAGIIVVAVSLLG